MPNLSPIGAEVDSAPAGLPPIGSEVGATSTEAPTVDLKKKFAEASPLERLKMLLEHPVDKYVRSVEQSFEGSTAPKMVRTESTPADPLVNQVAAGVANTGAGFVNGALSAGGVETAANPLATLYTAPYFLGKGIQGLAGLLKPGTVQQKVESGLGGVGMVAGGVGALAHGIPAAKSLIPEVESVSKLQTPAEANAAANAIALKVDPEGISGGVSEPAPNILSEVGHQGQLGELFKDNPQALTKEDLALGSGDVTHGSATSDLGDLIGGRPRSEPTPDATAAQKAIEDSLGIGVAALSDKDIVALATDPRTAPDYKAKIIEEAKKRNLADAVAGVNEGTTTPASDTLLADRLKQSLTGATGERAKTSAPKLGDLLGQDVHYSGYTGKLVRDPEGNFAVLQPSTEGKPNLVEIADTGKDSSKPAKDVGVNPIIAFEPVLGRGLKDIVEPRSSLPEPVSPQTGVPALPVTPKPVAAKETPFTTLPATEIAKLTPDEFLNYFQRKDRPAGVGLTEEALAAGDTTSPDILAKERDNATAEFSKAMQDGDHEAGMALAAKAQYFSEAYQKATKTGNSAPEAPSGSGTTPETPYAPAIGEEVPAPLTEKDIIKQKIEAAPSANFDPTPLKSSPGERQGLVGQVGDKVYNAHARASNAIGKGFRQTINTDVNLANLDDNNPSGPLQNIFKAKVDIAYQIEQNLKDAWKDIIRKATEGQGLDEKSMERVNIYAIDRMNQANPDLPNTHLEDSGVAQSTIDNIRENGLTNAEQEFYNKARKVLDTQSYPAVKEVMKNEYDIDVSKLKDYWPLQRDYSTFVKGVERPEPLIEPGTEAALDDLTKSMVNDFSPQNTSKTPQGQTKARVQGAGGAVNLKSNVIDRHINQAAHLVAMSHDLKLLGSIARGEAFKQKYGVEGQKFVNDWLDSVARDSDPVGSKSSPAINAAIRNTGVGILALRFLSQGKHVSNAVIATRELGPRTLFEGMAQSFTKEGKDFIKQNFPEVFQRAGGEETIQQLIEGGWISRAQGKFFLPERVIDMALSRASVLGAYMKELAAKGIDPTTYAEIPIDREAQAKALVTSRKVVTSSLRKDAPQALSRGTLTGGNMTLKNAIFQFQSTMLKNAGYAKHEIFDKGLAEGNYLAATTAAATVLGVLATAASITIAQKNLMQKVTGSKPKENTPLPEDLAKEIAVEGFRQVPVVGPIASATLTHGQTGIPVVDTYTHGLNAIGQLAGFGNGPFGKPITGKLKSDAKNDAATFLGNALGVPGSSTIGQFLKQSK